MAVCTGIAESVLLTSAVRPAMFSRLPFHRGMREATASMSPCSSPRLSLKIDNGMPR